KDMLIEEDLDIISICAPTEYHSEILGEIVTRRSVKAIFCEKPMSHNDNIARKMVDLCKDHGIILAVNYMRRWDKRNLAIKEIIEKEELGNLLSISAYGATAMLTSASHLIDLVLFFAGEPLWICGDIQTDFIRKVHGKDDPGGMAFIKFENGIYAFLKCTSKDPIYYMFELDLLFSEGRITIADDGRNYMQYKFDDIVTSSGSGYKSLVETAAKWDSGKNERMLNAIDDIIDCIENNGTPKSNGSNAVDVLKVIGLVQKSYSNGNETQPF
ncbi:Gfo/Idh/MocA family oxidoreductase, partial [Candidatus Marinimicrobia bacterium MT.SAG.3]